MKASFDYSFSEDLRRTLYFFSGFAGFGVVVVGLSATSRAELATLLAWSFACLLSGALIGFLFGIPKILQDGSNAKSEKNTQSYRQQVNTNLEQISDWLTKIIVGLGLVHLSKLRSYLSDAAALLTVGLGKDENHKAFAVALIVYFAILGFLFGYVATRLFLAGAFSRADQGAAAAIQQIKEIARKLSPDLLKQFLLGAKTETIIEGEASFQKQDPESPTEQEPTIEEEPEVNKTDDRDDFHKVWQNLPGNK